MKLIHRTPQKKHKNDKVIKLLWIYNAEFEFDYFLF